MRITLEQAGSGNWYRLDVTLPSGTVLLHVDGTRAVCLAALVAMVEALPGHNVPLDRQ